MKPPLELPLGLLALTSATVAAATFTSTDRRIGSETRGISLTSSADPFKNLRLRAIPKTSEPVCCLVPSPSDAVPSAPEFLSFEEWKSKQLELQAQSAALNHTPLPNTSASNASSDSPSPTTSVTLADAEAHFPPSAETTPPLFPHFPVPLTDRYNYASLDCSARVHTSHRAARFPSAILSSKKDRYMLSPCSANPNFIVVELCDDIRIDTIQLANFEFFSGVFRDFTVSVAQSYTNDGHEWVEAGTYTAKNIRGVQSFHPQVELRPFYRYVRIDFSSHYGNEFYCPISLLRVYGLNQLEEWKWEVWRGGSERINMKSVEDITQEHKSQTALPDHQPSNEVVISSTVHSPTIAESIPSSEDTESSSILQAYTISLTQEREESSPPTLVSDTLKTATQSVTQTVSAHLSPYVPTNLPSTNQDDKTPFAEKNISSNSTTHLMNVTASISQTESINMSTSSVTVLPAMTPIPSSAPIASGESVFRTIMNRLTTLEVNTTLYQKYVQEQTLHMRDALRRLEEDVGRLHGINKAQQQLFSRTIHELEHRRYRMEEERSELLNRVNHLTEEVNLEKRLGIAQLCLLLTVLIFMALTRGSRTDATSLLNGTMRELHTLRQRSPWSSLDWTKKNRDGRSPTPTPAHFSRELARNPEPKAVLIASPISSPSSPQPKAPRSPTPRTQPLRRPNTPRHHDVFPGSSGRSAGRLQRSNSHTLPARVSTSAKRFAYSAHLHQVKPSSHRSEVNGSDSETIDREKNGNLNFQHSHEKEKGKDGKLNNLEAASSEGSEPESWIDTEPGSEPGDELDLRQSQ